MRQSKSRKKQEQKQERISMGTMQQPQHQQTQLASNDRVLAWGENEENEKGGKVG